MRAAGLDGSAAAPGVAVQLPRAKLPLGAGRCRRASALRSVVALTVAPAVAPRRRAGAFPAPSATLCVGAAPPGPPRCVIRAQLPLLSARRTLSPKRAPRSQPSHAAAATCGGPAPGFAARVRPGWSRIARLTSGALHPRIFTGCRHRSPGGREGRSRRRARIRRRRLARCARLARHRARAV